MLLVTFSPMQSIKRKPLSCIAAEKEIYSLEIVSISLKLFIFTLLLLMHAHFVIFVLFAKTFSVFPVSQLHLFKLKIIESLLPNKKPS